VVLAGLGDQLRVLTAEPKGKCFLEHPGTSMQSPLGCTKACSHSTSQKIVTFGMHDVRYMLPDADLYFP
jgi:hypothetical protein